MKRATLAIIGGSGLYTMKALRNPKPITVKTPFGKHSGPLILGTLSGVDCAFLPRHGKGHVFLPSEINGRANIYALKTLGVERILAMGAVGSLCEDLAPRHFVFPDQLVDETKNRRSTFFGEGLVAHVAFAEPFCDGMQKLLYGAAKSMGITAHQGGVYACMEGPAFSSRGESEYHRRMGYSVIGMTAVPEAKLAREAEICYSLAALVTDYDCWKEGDEVTSAKVVEILSANTANAQNLIAKVLPALAALPRKCPCASALSGALFTAPEMRSRAALRKLKPLLEKYIK